MQFLKPLISKITSDPIIISDAKKMNNDEELLCFLEKNEIETEVIFKSLERHYGFPFIDLRNVSLNPNIVNQFELELLEKNLVYPYRIDDVNKVYYFAINEITNKNIMQIINDACKTLGYNTEFKTAFHYQITDFFKKSNEMKKDVISEDDVDVQKWVDDIINEGIMLGASDIHIEKTEFNLKVRYRLDGLLSNIKTFNFSETLLSAISVRIKIISYMDISEKRKPQDGRITDFISKGKKYDIRVSSVTTIFGEKFVMRLIPKTNEIQSFKGLGFNSINETKIKRMLNNKNGIIYLAGATGSGKTTTLYTMIEEVNTDDVNIYTIENPVEKTVDNVNQIQVNEKAGQTYSNILQALLRQDPDIIVVGEIRDVDTAGLSVRASLTGHLVLTTIHGNNALDAVSRLLDMGIEPYLISASSIGFISQRLVRTLCPHCKKKVEKLASYERVWLDNVCEEYDLPSLPDDTFYEANGCERCNKGYKGRIGVIELVEVSDKVKSLLSKEPDLSIIKQVALEEGFKPLVLDGIEKAINGITTISELIKQIN